MAVDAFADNFGTILRTLMQLRGISVQEMRERLGFPRQTWYARMNDGNWTARQTLRLADELGVVVDDLFREPSDLFPTVGSSTT